MIIIKYIDYNIFKICKIKKGNIIVIFYLTIIHNIKVKMFFTFLDQKLYLNPGLVLVSVVYSFS